MASYLLYMSKVTVANFIVSGKKLASSMDLLNSEYKASVKMSGLDLIIFVGISESWYINISLSISHFEMLLNLKYLFVILLFIATIQGQFLYCSIHLVMESAI